jgi:hypothetical protein
MFAATPPIQYNTSAMQLRPTVLLAVSNRKAFLQSYYERNGACGVWVLGPSTHDLGTRVDLEIAFAEEQIVLHSCGVIRAKRPADRGSLRAGIGVDFLASEQQTRELILAFASGRQDLVRRRSRRLPVVMDVEVVTPRGRQNETSENISRDGAMITCASPLEMGSVAPLVLKPVGMSPIELRGEVRWRRIHERPAIGVRFIFEDPARLREMAALIDVLRARLAG